MRAMRAWRPAGFVALSCMSVASGADWPPHSSCPVAWLNQTEVHDMHPATDMMNAPDMSIQECANLCCSTDGCAAFMHTSDQASSAGNCSQPGHPCCWLKPTLNVSRLHDHCSTCTSGIIKQKPPPPPPANCGPSCKCHFVQFPPMSGYVCDAQDGGRCCSAGQGSCSNGTNVGCSTEAGLAICPGNTGGCTSGQSF